jgi:uncharacterized protein (TIGR03435 family)
VQQASQRAVRMQVEEGVTTFQLVANARRLIDFLAMFVDRPVVDRTGLTGVYEISVRVELEPTWQEAVKPGQKFYGFGHTPSIFPAVEGMGLKLVEQKQPAEILVVDHVERPTEN